MATVLSGASFGAAMIAAGFYNPAVVVAQLRFENWHMVQAFLAATASSIVYYAVSDRTGYTRLTPRASAPVGLLPTTYDGNILGGALLGAGMALSGSCPGTLFAQMAAGVHTGFYALAGAVVGGVLWTGILSKAVARQRARAGHNKPETVTIDQYLGISKPAAMLLYEAGFAAVVSITWLYTPRFPGTKMPGALGGLLISLSQLASIATRGSMIGISGSFGELGGLVWAALAGEDAAARPAAFPNVLFAVSAGAGALLLATLAPTLVDAPVLEVAPAQAVLGGALMVVGARMAGGCTSGHGISGISLLSTSSLITIATTFAAGFVVASLVY
ncbi:YeeE/YedE family protein [Beauveria bassiana ARSEF 2860]|uniref:YeeE/YedE family protein n=1 Tax=Beauveria bassiana (strain ARSEF 2860) TaxID=655819 RepID=J4KKW9_BEAB2|nr:YeeE/YedE family protein [Beauveria bassiana ARSEF 2860]EJP61184.1 YeeE/YedE family protein [Beauveria bassiana ARSEF 2860]